MPAPSAPTPRPVLAISMGDPGGIGAEVVVKALADPVRHGSARHRVYGSSAAMLEAARGAGIEPYWVRVPRKRAHALPHVLGVGGPDVILVDSDGMDDAGLDAELPVHERRSTAAGGALSFQYVEDAIADAKRAAEDPLRADAIVTAPISKEAWALAGHGDFPGHTELLAARFNAPRAAMMFEADPLRVILVTTHIPLSEVARAVTAERVLDVIEMGHGACVGLGVEKPRIAVCGLNPHAGEQGLLGDDEQRVIVPAMERARAKGMDVAGPFPGDTVFNAAVRKRYDLVVAMYHDQGLIPVKLLAFDRAVNVTLGLPTVRTSPDHGTAFDIAGRNVADPGSMGAAIDLAIRLAGRVSGSD
ncbi:MAG: 4-hydroxythreonine-4-phosphate dehydrogenase PdxA [Phycisphaeraceae bacterium]|nr:4-hydroxythreonine-4-phosphate dehydrogenase PdxA [Phycisphaeraceae bacterium]